MYPILVGGLSVLITGDIYFTDGRMGTGLPNDARGWLGGKPQAWIPLQGLNYGTQGSLLRSKGAPLFRGSSVIKRTRMHVDRNSTVSGNVPK